MSKKTAITAKKLKVLFSSSMSQKRTHKMSLIRFSPKNFKAGLSDFKIYFLKNQKIATFKINEESIKKVSAIIFIGQK